MALPPASTAKARRLVDRIIERNGFVRESSLDTMSQEVRREVEEALLAKDRRIGSSVLTLAQNLYTSKARFVFEVLQNTEDNQYSAALAAGKEPFVSFRLYHDRLVVDCNEDGFTEDNLSAICDIGNSSKSGSQGYIGEKGIGFKSVFMAAWKVHIQSGYLSFSFIHRKGDSGMGMVKPRWEEPTETLPQPHHTRITLFLHDSLDGDQMSRNREDILKQFQELEPAILLFVSKLKRIEVVSYDQYGQQDWATRLSRQEGAEVDRVVLERRVGDTAHLDSVAPESHIYHVTEHMATNVARHENRDLSTSEEASPSSRQSKIVLAFPVSRQSVPIIEPQKVFAFLPMKQMGFNFLIQADFVTQANREDVVTTSARNKDLIQGVIDAMIETIRQLCEHDVLQYTWMRYLPCDGTHHWDPFWKTIVDGIKERLQEESVVRTRGTRVLRPINKLRELPAQCCDQHGHPLLPDLNPEIYISDSYEQGDICILKDFGLEVLNITEVLNTVRQDLLQTSSLSRFRSPRTDDDWHTRASALLLLPWERDWKFPKGKLRDLELIPLNNGSWVRAVDDDIFYDKTGSTPIPKDLGLKIVSARATKNAKRRALFNNLGVKLANTHMIRSRILDLHDRGGFGSIRFHHSLEHLKFLYLTHESRSEGELKPDILVYDHLNFPRSPLKYDFYVRDDHPYGAESLLATYPMLFTAGFVNPKYFENAPNTPSGTSLTWVEWLYEYVGVRRKIRLLGRDGTTLSGECRHIAENQGDKFLGFLKHVWPEEGDDVVKGAGIREEIFDLPVPCTNGTRQPLRFCYMPLRELQGIRQRFFADTEIMNLIDIPSSDDASLLSDWSFLTKDIGVNFRNDLDFRLALLRAFLFWAMPSLTTQQASKLLDIYRYIESWCMVAEDPEAMRARIHEEFGAASLILAPPFEDRLSDWERNQPEGCLWEAPDNFYTMRPLKALYSAAGMDVEGEGDCIRQFFQGTLRIPNISHEHILKELQDTDRQQQQDIQTVRNLYQLLQDMYQADPTIAESLRDSFEASGLVYVEREGSSAWYPQSACLWSSATSIDGKVAINDLFPKLKPLFKEVLGVPDMTLAMVYRSLLGAASSNASVQRVKELLLTFNSLLPGEPKPPNPRRLLQSRIFPVKLSGDGNTTALCSREMEFFIVDRDDLFAAFGDHVRCLDLSLNEVCRMRPFISWAGLESRYLSRCVKEVSKVHGGVEWPIRDSKRDMRRKAHGLLRIAAMHGSPRYNADPHALYSLLRTAVTVETDGISSTLVLHQDGNDYEHEVNESDLHIEERDGTLKIYVPHDEDAWDDCFLHALPLRLLSWMMASPGSIETAEDGLNEAAIGVIISILSCGEAAVPALLKRKGVPEIAKVKEEPLPDATYPSVVTPETRSTPENDHTSETTPPTDLGDYDFGRGQRPRTFLPEQLSVGRTQAAVQEKYRPLLASAIVMAKRVARQDYGSRDITSEFVGLSLEEDDVFPSTLATREYLSTSPERYREIGAAGELFVFELLSNLAPRLPSFGRDNWQSTIRHYANAHPKHSDLTPFVGRETSDIVYDDVSGVLTALLISKGHLSSSQWAGQMPRYYIEIKSTLNSCETPFYVSPGQAERMLRTTNGPSGSENQHEIYVVFRVFSLGTEATGLRIYVDPEEQRRTGKLKFTTTESYTVVPGVVV